jgi:hypothetical protein
LRQERLASKMALARMGKRLMAEATLFSSNRKFDCDFLLSPESIKAVDPEGRVLTAQTVTLKIAGQISSSATLGKDQP